MTESILTIHNVKDEVTQHTQTLENVTFSQEKNK